jgi:hypothetical protein
LPKRKRKSKEKEEKELDTAAFIGISIACNNSAFVTWDGKSIFLEGPKSNQFPEVALNLLTFGR